MVNITAVCYCVNPITGEEIYGTKFNREQAWNCKRKCDHSSASIVTINWLVGH